MGHTNEGTNTNINYRLREIKGGGGSYQPLHPFTQTTPPLQLK